MTARDIQHRLMVDRYRRSFVLPNYTPRGWFECDVFELTEAGYMREYEIKVSRSDFKADALKLRIPRRWESTPAINKHTQLNLGNSAGPRQFWFVGPESVFQDGVPLWAGLIIAHDRPHVRRPYKVRLEIVRPAPILHKHKADPNVVEHARRMTNLRWVNMLLFGKVIDREVPET